MEFHINESSMANILSFLEFAKIVGVHINMDTYKEKLINVHIKDGKILYFKSCAERLFYTNIKDPTIITSPNNVYLNAYSYLYTVKQNSDFLLILKFKKHTKLESYNNILTGVERQILRLTYNKECFTNAH